jgi:AcrR family transcriptional regulator
VLDRWRIPPTDVEMSERERSVDRPLEAGVPHPRRRYELRKRREAVEATRNRIVEAAARVHERVGPARATITAVAAEAGVQRITVYRHFPDAGGLLAATLARREADRPMPEPGSWRAIGDPDERLRRALTEVYRYWEGNEAWIGVLVRDLADLPPSVGEARAGALDPIRDVLLEGRPRRAVRRRALEAALGHALSFETWFSLVRREGLTTEEAVDLMVGFVARA